VPELPVRDNQLFPNTLPPAAHPVAAPGETQPAEEAFCQSLPPLLVQARRAFQRELPRLLRECPQHWVAFRADGQVAAPDRSKTRLYQQCLQLGLRPGEFLLLAVSAESGSFLKDVALEMSW
jgi:hypothetical protein